MVSIINPSSTQHLASSYNSYGPPDFSSYSHVPPYGMHQFPWPSALFSRSFSRPENTPASYQAQSRSRYSSKDYSKPLFVDCSIEYELPNAPKVPKNSEPILMIHPGYKRPRAILKAKTPLNPRSDNSSRVVISSSVTSDKKSLKRKQPSYPFPIQQQDFLRQEPVNIGCCCHCHPLASKRNRSLLYDQFRQQQEQLLQYQQGLNHFRYGNNWT